jgi:hypothetical protein
MSDPRFVPSRVALEAGGEATVAVSFELSGHHAAVRSARRLSKDAPVCVRIDWASGAHTSLPGRVASSDDAGVDSVTHVDVCAIEDDWRPFLAYVGPSLRTN